MLYNIHHGLSKYHLDVLQLDEFIDMVVYFKFFLQWQEIAVVKNTLCVEGSVVKNYQ